MRMEIFQDSSKILEIKKRAAAPEWGRRRKLTKMFENKPYFKIFFDVWEPFIVSISKIYTPLE